MGEKDEAERHEGEGTKHGRDHVLDELSEDQASQEAEDDCGRKDVSADDSPGPPESRAPRVLPAHCQLTKIEISVHYHDGTIQLHHRMHGIRQGKVEQIFSIEHFPSNVDSETKCD